MDYLREPQAVYTSLLSTAFEKVHKSLNSRKHKELREVCLRSVEAAKQDSSLDASAYFAALKQALETKVTKVLEIVLDYLQRLISHGFLTGSGADTLSQSQSRAAA